MAKQRKEPAQDTRRASQSGSGQRQQPAQLVEDVGEAQRLAMEENRMREQRRKGGRG